MRFFISKRLAIASIILLFPTVTFAETPTQSDPRMGSGMANEWVEYAGDIDGKLRIDMTLCPDADGVAATGTYFYEKYRRDIRVVAQLTNRVMVIREFDAKGNITASFTGELAHQDPRRAADFDGEVITGFWSKPGGARQLPFYLSKVATGTGSTLTAVEESQAVGDGVTISGVHIVASRPEEGSARYQLTSAGKTVRFENERSATVYVERPRTNWLMIQDAFVSNEDRILIYDPSHLDRAPQVLAHDHTIDDYGHCHYEIGTLIGNDIRLTENEWAGSKPPRSRRLTLRHTPAGISLIPDAWTPSAP